MNLPLAVPDRIEERADARRNRERILGAAERLIAAHGVDDVSMDDVAAEAGVGKGTLYRRFGDRASLVRALVEEHERAFQDALIRGEPPLGPGAPARDRLHAFARGLLGMLDRHGAYILAAESDKPGARFRAGPYRFYRLHLGVLLREALGEDGPHVEYLADALLAPLSAELVLHQTRGRGVPLEDVLAGWCALVDAVLAAKPA